MSKVVPTVATRTAEEQAALSMVAKYSTVFRLIPTRVSQILQVVNAYPASDVVRRTDLLQIAIQRMHDIYRITQRLQNRVIEIKDASYGSGQSSIATQCALLIESLKKYQITLISTLSVFDSEFVRSVKRMRTEGESHPTGSASAYQAAKAVLKHSQMDVLIETMAGGAAGVGAEVSGGSVKNEIRELRDQVSLLSSQLQSKALLDGERGAGDEKVFSQHIGALAAQNADAVRAAQQSLTTVNAATASLVKNKKHSLRHGTRKGKTLTVSGLASLQKRAAQWYCNVVAQIQAAAVWVVDSVPYVGQIGEMLVGFVRRIFTDSHKALTHVGTRMKEVQQITPEGVSVAANGVWSFGSWIMESWLRIGAYVVAITVPVRAFIAEKWALLMQRSKVLDDAMRAFVYRIFAVVKEYRIWLWDGAVVYDEDKEEEVMVPGKIKVWAAQGYDYAWQVIGQLKEYIKPAVSATATNHTKNDNRKEETAPSLMQQVAGVVSEYSKIGLEKITQIYKVSSEYLLFLKNRYFPPLVVVTEKK